MSQAINNRFRKPLEAVIYMPASLIQRGRLFHGEMCLTVRQLFYISCFLRTILVHV